MMKKSIFLFLTLAIPVSIFLFLKYFGSNTFEVPYLFESGIPDCPEISSPHRVTIEEYIGETEKNIVSESLNGFMIFGVLNQTNTGNNADLLIELVRIQDAFYEIGSPYFVLIPLADMENKHELPQLLAEAGLERGNFMILKMEENILLEFLKCGIALIDENTSDFNNLVLVDPERRIRGIYNYLDREQTDRLILELKILKQKM